MDYVLSEPVPTSFQLLSLKNNSTFKALMDPGLLMKTGSSLLKSLSVHVLREIFMQPASRNTTGLITFTEDRLQVKEISTAFIYSFLGILVALSIGMIYVRPHAATPFKPYSIAFIATVVANSPNFQKTLNISKPHVVAIYTSARVDLNGRAVLKSETASQSVLEIEPIRSIKDQSLSQTPEDGVDVSSWWRPAAGTSWFLSLGISLPLLLIGAIETVQHFSDVSDGFIDVVHNNSTLFATYVPAAVLIGVASTYSALDQTAAIFTSFAALKRGKARAE